jgi:hypothetical protein
MRVHEVHRRGLSRQPARIQRQQGMVDERVEHTVAQTAARPVIGPERKFEARKTRIVKIAFQKPLRADKNFTVRQATEQAIRPILRVVEILPKNMQCAQHHRSFRGQSAKIGMS